VTRSKDGLGGAAVKAVNAGVDLLLLSSADDYFDTVMSALIDADSKGAINQARQIESRERMSKYVFIDDSPPSASPPVQAQQQPQQQPPRQN
jgi:beta-N-acetylhexosaminidase